MSVDFEAVIGLEVHAQLLTKTKAFCACASSFGAEPNTNVCPVCLGLPGSLPVLNAEAVRMAVRAALALGCTVHQKSVFARKSYFYPDLPKGYQISQFDEPLATNGVLEIQVGDEPAKKAGITRIHMEEDAGKNLHGIGGGSVVDLNRAGTPLIEIVGEPDLRSPAEAAEYLRRLRDVLMALGVNDGNLEEGSFRCDANVSIRPKGSEKFGVRCEIKNVNSFRFVEKALAYEIARQASIVSSGGTVVPETRGWNEAEGRTFSLRSKEEAQDYRYFPDPDLPPLVLDEAFIGRERERLPELPEARRKRWVSEWKLTPYAANVLSGHPAIASYFEEAVKLHGDPIKVANFVQTEVLRDVKTSGLDASFPASAKGVAELLALVDDKTISGKQAKDVYAEMVASGKAPKEIVAEKGMAQITDAAALEEICRKVVDANPKQVEGYRKGKTGLLGFFVGQVMKETKGSANPKLVNEILTKLLSG